MAKPVFINVPLEPTAMLDTTVRNCRNWRCQYVGNPDPREYPECEFRCPRCGVPWDQRPAWKGPPDGGDWDVF